MRDCPACLKPVDGLVCGFCGFRDPAAPPDLPASRPIDLSHFLCCHVDRGQRCAHAGTLTESTKGSDRWYCAQHFPLFAGRVGKHTAPPGGFKSIHAALQPMDEETRLEREAIRDESLQRATREAENVV